MNTYGYGYAGTASGMSDASIIAILLGSTVYMLCALVLTVILIIAFWKIFTKAGEPGWASIVPFYSNYMLFKIAWGNGWLFLLTFIPVIGGIVALVAFYKLCVAFGYGVGFFLGLIFLMPIFFMIMAFGPSEYQGPA